jgi:peptidyl-tRNA hydrolase, PTH2 family
MRNLKQVIVMRKDLNMRKGKMIVQGSHASMKVFFDRMWKQYDEVDCLFHLESRSLSDAMIEWFEGTFTKICVSVNSEAELLEIYEKTKTANLPIALIEDIGLTEFNGVPTKTCLAIGPDESEKIDIITGHLSLL